MDPKELLNLKVKNVLTTAVFSVLENDIMPSVCDIINSYHIHHNLVIDKQNE